VTRCWEPLAHLILVPISLPPVLLTVTGQDLRLQPSLWGVSSSWRLWEPSAWCELTLPSSKRGCQVMQYRPRDTAHSGPRLTTPLALKGSSQVPPTERTLGATWQVASRGGRSCLTGLGLGRRGPLRRPHLLCAGVGSEQPGTQPPHRPARPPGVSARQFPKEEHERKASLSPPGLGELGRVPAPEL
jgi:hypothetical protein